MWAAVCFAICHLVAMGTHAATAGGSADLEGEIPRQVIHFVAELCRSQRGGECRVRRGYAHLAEENAR